MELNIDWGRSISLPQEILMSRWTVSERETSPPCYHYRFPLDNNLFRGLAILVEQERPNGTEYFIALDFFYSTIYYEKVEFSTTAEALCYSFDMANRIFSEYAQYLGKLATLANHGVEK